MSDRLDIFRDILNVIRSGQSEETLLRTTFEGIRRCFAADCLEIVISEDGRFQSIARFETNQTPSFERRDFHDRAGFVKRVMNDAESLFLSDITGDQPFSAKSVSILSFGAVPIVARTLVSGVMLVGFQNKITHEPDQRLIFENLADLISIGRERLHLRQKLTAMETLENRVAAELESVQSKVDAGQATQDLISDLMSSICDLIHRTGDYPDSLEPLDSALLMLERINTYKQVFLQKERLTCEPLSILEDVSVILRDQLAGEGINVKLDFPQTSNRENVYADAKLLTAVVYVLLRKLSASTSEISIKVSSKSESAFRVINFDIAEGGSGNVPDTFLKLFAMAGVEFRPSDKGLVFIFDRFIPMEELHGNAGQPHSRLLIVDDDDDLRELMVDILESRNYEVVCCMDSTSAMDMFKKDHYDMMITDLSLPKISGSELAAEVKRLDPNMPIIMMTGWNSESMDMNKERLHVDYLLPKPFNLNELLTTVETGISRNKILRN